ncbi:hypothetical protein A5666_24400 [Mycolicibacterium fortuitum]|nr:hypothetical protein A5665_24520 [Mycolicibacterium fortuitum]OBI69904.1 hypothetical protein A5666_24400 [Mycolicibacterium fortuitum]
MDWAEHDKNVEAMANAAFARLSELDRNTDAQNRARVTINQYRDSLKATKSDPLIAEHRGLQYDPARPETANRLYALLAFDPSVLIPLSSQYTWKDVAAKYLPHKYTTCDVSICTMCDPKGGTLDLAIKVGEFVCVYKCCTGCREFFDMTPDERERFDKSGYFDEIDRR